MEYQLCEANTAQQLQSAVNNLLEQGWRPFGSVAVVNGQSGNWWYYQAVVRERDAAQTPPISLADPASKPRAPSFGEFV